MVHTKTAIAICLALVSVSLFPQGIGVVLDQDQDGMPDEWELHYGLDPTDSSDATRDYDRDGLSNIREYQNGTNPDNALSGGKAQVSYTYLSQMTAENTLFLFESGINTICAKGGLSNNVNYSLHDECLPENVLSNAALAEEHHFMFFQAMNFVHRHFPDDSVVDDAYAVVYADGVEGKHVSPFSEAYWDHLTSIVVALANLSINYPATYRIDGVMFDFELYCQEDDDRPRYFDGSFGFEDQTFTAYIDDRDLSDMNPPISSEQRAERYDWLEDNSLLDDYYDYLGTTIQEYATVMRDAVDAVNPAFLIGSYPSPITSRWYLSEIYSGWSTEDDPCVLWATEMYNSGGADNIPDGMDACLLPEGYFNLTSIYPSQITNNISIHAYYVGGTLLRQYFVGNIPYHFYNLAQQTQGYWMFTTYSMTGSYGSITPGYMLPYYDAVNNTLEPLETEDQFNITVERYCRNLSLVASYNEQKFNDSSYDPQVSLVDPPPVVFDDVSFVSCPINVTPLEEWSGELYSFAENQLRFRGQHEFLFSAQKNQYVNIGVKHRSFGSYEMQNGISYSVLNATSAEVHSGRIYPSEQYTINFTAQTNGSHLLIINPDSNAFEILNSSVPIAVYQSPGEHTHIMSTEGSLFYWVPYSAGHFLVNVSGSGAGEGVNASVWMPVDDEYSCIASDETSSIRTYFSLNVSIPRNATNTTWRLDVRESSTQYYEDVFAEVSSSIPPFFSLTDNNSFIFTYDWLLEDDLEEEGVDDEQQEPEDPPGGGSSPSGGSSPPSTGPPDDDNDQDNDNNQTGDANETTNATIPPEEPEKQAEDNSTGNTTTPEGPIGIINQTQGQNLGDQPGSPLNMLSLPFFVYFLGVVCIIGGGMSMVWLKIRHKPVEFNESQAEILELISLAKQNMSDHKLAWRYYHEAREKLLSQSQYVKRKQYSAVQKQLIEVYSMLLIV